MTDEQEAHPAEAVESMEPVGPESRAELSDLQDTVDDLIVHLHEAKNVLVRQCHGRPGAVPRDVGEDSRRLPDELRAARWMVREREAFIARTNEKPVRSWIVPAKRPTPSSRIRTSWPRPSKRRTSWCGVPRVEARRLRLETEDEIERKLQRAELILNQVLDQIQDARDELHEAAPQAARRPALTWPTISWSPSVT